MKEHYTHMNTSYLPIIGYQGAYTAKRMYQQPLAQIPINYATAAIPRYAPFGTDYTPDYSTKIIGSRYVSIPEIASNASKHPSPLLAKNIDPDLAPTKTIQHAHAQDSPQWPQQTKSRFDTTYRTEFINRIRHPDQIAKPIRNLQSSFNQYSVLPPINTEIVNRNNDIPRSNASARTTSTDVQSEKQPFRDQQMKFNESMPNDIPPLNFNNSSQNFYGQPPPLPPPPPPPQQQQQQPMIDNIDTYMTQEPVLLTDYEEQRLAEQVSYQLGYSSGVEKLKVFYQELTAYDPNLTRYVHYSTIQLLAAQIGLGLQDDTLRFSMCKFVAPNRPRGFVNYEDMVRYFGRCLAYTNPHQLSQQRNPNSRSSNSNNGSYNRTPSPQKQYQTRIQSSLTNLTDDGERNFDPDERLVRLLLRQNLRSFELNGSIDFDKLYRELKAVDRNQTGVLNRQQIEEVVYKVRIPLQRSLLFQILEKHCRAYLRLYKWEAFFQYLKEQILDTGDSQDQSNQISTQNSPTRNQWLDLIRKEYKETDRLRVVERFIANTEGSRLESHHPTAWFARFLRLANAMYTHRASTNRDHDFQLPRDEARRLFRAYNQVWDLKIDDDKIQIVLNACARGGNTAVDDALKLLAK
ncbi:unnamed protein product [Rotaria socialis]|uniref:DUF5580 domain-containing protein n=2 Tax=Rotaria socialis TaxID=392032 RepID=A0A818FH73_9BILA|nr:unnamed protein product [Rotaria socialis]